MSRVESLTKAVKTHDKELFCKQEGDKVLVCRQATVWESHDIDHGVRLLYSRRVPQVLFALTHNFSQSGKPIDLGIEPLIQRIKSIDMWGDFNEAKDVVNNLEKDQDIATKDRRNGFEDMAREMSGAFKKAFSDINVSNLEKIDKRRSNKWL